MNKIVLRINDLDIKDEQFGKLEHVSFYVRENEVTGLLGLDYSGNELLLKVLLGNVEIDWHKNRIYMNEERVWNFQEIRKYIYFFSEKNNVPDSWTVAEYLGLLDAAFFLRRGVIEKLNLKAETGFREMDVHFDVRKKMSELNELERRMVEVVKARNMGARILVIEDEFEGMDEKTIREYAAFLKKAIQGKMAVLLFSHLERAYREMSDEFIILRKGRLVKKLRNGNENNSIPLMNYLLGNTLIQKKRSLDSYSREKNRDDGITYEVWNLSMRGKNQDFYFREGTITTFVLLNNAERKEFFLALSGRKANRHWEYVMDGERFVAPKFKTFLAHKIVSAMKLKDNDEIFGNMTTEDNLLLPSLDKISNSDYLFLGDRIGQSLYNDFKSDLHPNIKYVKDMNPHQKINIALERWYVYNPSVIILYDPFTSSDAYGVSIILSYIKKLANRGASVIVIKSTAEYMEEISDHIFNLD